ncbi:MAG TPA: ABC transporter permease subunit [Candidatus Binataceae bacterium]|nr:ABC transporter permease subunit [Candidatus Binataceae bacterium]
MANGAATLEVAQGAGERRQAALSGVRTGFSPARMLAVMRKELRSYFAFPLVYFVTAMFTLIAGYYAWSDLNYFTTMSFSHDVIQNYWTLIFTDVRLALIFSLPFITMRSFAEERKLGTVELLYTYPLRDGEILGGKFLACIVILLLMLALTTLYPLWMRTIHAFPPFPLLAGYLGLLLIGCALISFGVFVSSLCESQVVAGITTLVLFFFLWIANWNEAAFESSWLEPLRMISLFDNFNNFAKGIIEVDNISYFVFFTFFFLFLTLRSMEARKWTGRR